MHLKANSGPIVLLASTSIVGCASSWLLSLAGARHGSCRACFRVGMGTWLFTGGNVLTHTDRAAYRPDLGTRCRLVRRSGDKRTVGSVMSCNEATSCERLAGLVMYPTVRVRNSTKRAWVRCRYATEMSYTARADAVDELKTKYCEMTAACGSSRLHSCALCKTQLESTRLEVTVVVRPGLVPCDGECDTSGCVRRYRRRSLRP